MSAAYDIDTVLLEARLFLNAIDIDRRQLVFLQTSRNILAGAAFIDGRSQLAVDTQEIAVPLIKALEGKNYSFVYKEPQALIELVWRRSECC